MTRSIGFFIWFASGVKAFQTRAVPGSAADDLVARAVVENVNSAGEKSLEVSVKSKDSKVNFEVTEIKPSKIDVMFDKIDTREYELSVNAPNITAAEGLYMDSSEFKATPSVLSLIHISEPTRPY